jgi:hypothetical protein
MNYPATRRHGHSSSSQLLVEVQCDVLIKTAHEKSKNAQQSAIENDYRRPPSVSEMIRRIAV